MNLKGRDFLRVDDFSTDELLHVLDFATKLKGDRTPRLAGHTLGLVFAQPSTRTRISFSVAMAQLGGMPITLQASEMQL